MDISFSSKLKAMGACPEAVQWVGGRDLSTAWAECERPDWMLWLAARMEGENGWSDRKQIVLIAADIAESVLHLTREHDREVCQKAIQSTRDFANGLINRDAAYTAAYAADAAARAARRAAYAAYTAARAAYAAARAASYAAYAAARAAADAADAAADAASRAADAAEAAADAAAYAAKRREICQLIRERIVVGTV